MVVSVDCLKTYLLFKCIWKKVENSGKIREFCQEQNVETMTTDPKKKDLE